MDNGPDLFYLLQRLQSCPNEFLLSPILLSQPKNYKGEIQTASVVNDLLLDLGLSEDPKIIFNTLQLKHSAENANYLQLVLITSYLIGDNWFLQSKKYGLKVKELFLNKLKPLALLVEAKQFVLDSERREELVRFCLKELNLKPNGESETHANDRLTTINSIERQKLIEESKAAQKRAQELREAIARQEAEEAASKWNRE
jgi:hypothetical protein